MHHLNYDLIVFDWDGTLMDSTAAIVESIRDSALHLKLPVPHQEIAAHVIGLGLREAWEMIFPDLKEPQYLALMALYRRYYLINSLKITLFEGIKALLEKLIKKDYRLAIATGKSRQGLNQALKETGLTSYFDGTRTIDESLSKPNPEMLLELSNELQIPTQRMLMIGDTTHDLMMAHNAKVACVAVNYGAHSEEELKTMHPLYIANTVQALDHWLENHA